MRSSLSLALSALVAGTALIGVTAPAANAATDCVLDQSTVAECFPDPNFAWAVAEEAYIDTTDVFTSSAAADIRRNLLLFGVSSLEGIHNLVNLESVYIEHGELESLTPLLALQNLTEVHLYANGLTDANTLAMIPTLEHIGLYNLDITDVSSLSTLPNLTRLAVTDLPLRDISMFRPNVVNSWEGTKATELRFPISRAGRDDAVVVLRTGVVQHRATFGSHYEIDGTRHTFVNQEGDSASTILRLSADALNGRDTPLSPGKSVDMYRGDVVTGTYGPFERRAERRVSATGTITHTTTLTNTSAAPITTRSYDMADTELMDDYWVRVTSDSRGGFMISDDDVDVHFTAGEGIDRMVTGPRGRFVELSGAIENDTSLPSGHFAPGGDAGVDPGTELLDSVIYYVTDEFTLAPGESFRYSYSEVLYSADEQPFVTVNYVDGNGGIVQPDAGPQVFSGDDGTTLALDHSNLVPPTGFMVAPEFELPLAVVFGANGMETVVNIPVVGVPVIPSPTTFTVTFDSQGGSAVAPVSVDEGERLTLPANPTRAGHRFVGWTRDAQGAERFEPGTAITGDFTLYAQWSNDAAPPVNPGTKPGAKPGEHSGIAETGADSSGMIWAAGGAVMLLAAGVTLALARRRSL